MGKVPPSTRFPSDLNTLHRYKVIAVMNKSKTSYFTIRDSFEREFDRFSDADASLA